MSEIEVVPAGQLGDLTRLEPLARRIFGDGDRRPGWFARKLWREGVDPTLSMVAVEHGEPYGYVLVGMPLEGLARTAGVGVAAERRGRGVGSLLMARAARAAGAGGATRLRTLAIPARVGFYQRAGFVACRTNHSLLNFADGRGPEAGSPLPPPRAWDAIGDCTHEWCAWMQLAWERTPATERSTLELDARAVVHLSYEGNARLVHRLTTARNDDDLLAVLDTLSKRLPTGTPLILYGCNAVSSITSSLMRAGWVSVQTAIVMEKSLDP